MVEEKVLVGKTGSVSLPIVHSIDNGGLKRGLQTRLGLAVLPTVVLIIALLLLLSRPISHQDVSHPIQHRRERHPNIQNLTIIYIIIVITAVAVMVLDKLTVPDPDRVLSADLLGLESHTELARVVAEKTIVNLLTAGTRGAPFSTNSVVTTGDAAFLGDPTAQTVSLPGKSVSPPISTTEVLETLRAVLISRMLQDLLFFLNATRTPVLAVLTERSTEERWC